MMRDMARFIAVSAGLLFGALVAVALVWGLIMLALGGIFKTDEATPLDASMTNNEEMVNETSPLEVTAEGEPVTIEVEALPEAQQKALNTFGFEGETITISQTQMQCAEAAVGKERLAAIFAGDAPGPIEAAKLYGCKDE